MVITTVRSAVFNSQAGSTEGPSWLVISSDIVEDIVSKTNICDNDDYYQKDPFWTPSLYTHHFSPTLPLSTTTTSVNKHR